MSLPAFARIVEETGERYPTRAIVELPDQADRQPLPGTDVTWLHNPRIPSGASMLADAVREVRLPDGPGYVYAPARPPPPARSARTSGRS